MNLNIVNTLYENLGYTPTNCQSNAIELLSDFICNVEEEDIFIIKGYAGTGKTTLISSVVATLAKLNRKSVLLAPTGRAAKVVTLYSNKKASTIHRHIYYTKPSANGNLMLVKKQNKHTDTLFIVDEASMIQGDSQSGYDTMFGDNNLLDDLIEFVYSGKNCKLIFSGDTAQLPPVGLNISPALDEVYLRQRYEFSVMSYELREVVRQQLDSGILLNATQLRLSMAQESYEMPLFTLAKEYPDFVNLADRSDSFEAVGEAFSGRTVEDSVIICRSNKRANKYNQELRRSFLQQEDELSAGDLLMVVKNNYFWLPAESEAGFIANGDIIKIRRVQRIIEEYGFRFADVTVSMLDYPDMEAMECRLLLDTVYSEQAALSYADSHKLWNAVLADYSHITTQTQRRALMKDDRFLNALQVKFAYAMTCHKTQGGQWENVFIDNVFFNDDPLTKEDLRWLYTSITRATRSLYLFNYADKWFK